MRGYPTGYPFEQYKESLDYGRLARRNPKPVHGVDGDGNTGQPGRPSTQDSGLGAMGMHDRWAKPVEQNNQLDESEQITDGVDPASQ
jgi:hypothetical protein